MKRIEWPPGSGIVATYSPEEEAEVAALIASAERDGVARKTIMREVALLHHVKSAFDASMVLD